MIESTAMKIQTIKSTGITHGMHVTKITFGSGETTSRHYHKWTTEVYTVISGTGIISQGGLNQVVKSGDIIVIEPLTRHQIFNTGEGDLVIYSHKDRSAQFKDYFE